MSDRASAPDDGLCAKIAQLVRERGWNLEEFARRAHLNRLTVRHLILGKSRRLHNATVAACARALELTVTDLRERPLVQLLARVHFSPPPAEAASSKPPPDYDHATQPALAAWLAEHPDRAARLGAADLDELLSLQGTGGPLTPQGVSHYVEQLERRRRVQERVAAICGTEHIDLLEQLVNLLFERIQPYGGKK